MTNGERFSTHAIRALRGSGQISINGAAARRALVDDLHIIAAYLRYADTEAEKHEPIVVLVEARNRGRDEFAHNA